MSIAQPYLFIVAFVIICRYCSEAMFIVHILTVRTCKTRIAALLILP